MADRATTYRRKQYLVAPKFQLKYVGLILAIVFATGIICSYAVYYTMMLLLGDKLANVYPQGRLMSIVNMVNLRILFGMILITPVVVVIGIYASHKIAGPIFRIEKHLMAMASGDFSGTITLRKNDELISMAECINDVSASVKAAIAKQKETLANTVRALEAVRRAAGGNLAAIEPDLNKLNAELSNIGKDLARYKL